MSERRQLALLFAAAAVLAAVGVVAATVFPEPCEEVEGIGQLELAFVAAGAALPLDDEEAAQLEALGAELGIGEFRGAVALPAGTTVLPSDFGFFAVTADDLVALRPGSSRASAPRAVTGLDVVAVGGTSAGLVTDDGTIAVISSDYERERCGTVPVGADVLSVDRGFALLRTDSGARLWALSGGGERWTIDPEDGVRDGLLAADRTLLVLDDGVAVGTLDEPSPVVTLPLEDPRTLAAVGGRLLLVEEAAPSVLVDVLVEDTAADPPVTSVTTEAAGPVIAAAPTPAGVVLATRDGLATDRGTSAVLPDGIVVTEVVASEDGHVGVVTPSGDGGDVLLVWGRDLPAVTEG